MEAELMHHDDEEALEEEDYVLLDLEAVFAQVDITPNTPYVLSVRSNQSLSYNMPSFCSCLLTLKIISLTSLASSPFNFFDISLPLL
jgi:general transcription factor 3C polypeptide 6